MTSCGRNYPREIETLNLETGDIADYRTTAQGMRELLTAKANVDRVLKMEVEQDVEKEKDHGQR